MDGLSLLRQAEEAGLAVALDGGRLVIRGPKRAEPVARLLIEHKSDVLAVLVRTDRMPMPAMIERQNAAEAQAWTQPASYIGSALGIPGRKPNGWLSANRSLSGTGSTASDQIPRAVLAAAATCPMGRA
jgi:hypothetical protein